MKRIISIVLLACLLCGMMAGCKAKKQANSATDVEIVYWETGYGRAWLDAAVKHFNESQDVYHATVVASAENRIAEIERGDATGKYSFLSFCHTPIKTMTLHKKFTTILYINYSKYSYDSHYWHYYQFFVSFCLCTKVVMSLRTSGEIVSSSLRYSATAPVLLC